MQDRRRGHRSRAGEHQANGGDRSRTRRRGTRREARAESGQRLSGEAIWNVKLGLGLGAARSGACILYQEGDSGSRGRGLVGLGQPMGRGGTGPPLWTGPCPCRATGQGGGPSPSWSLGPGRPGPGGHRAVPFSGRAASPWAAWPSIHVCREPAFLINFSDPTSL